jgi:flagellar motor switch/type III secretory pathway protein FliN
MATGQQTVQDGPQGRSTQELAEERALVPSPTANLFDGLDLCAPDSPVSRIPVEIDVAIPVRGFRVANLLTLAEGHVIESQWLQGEDMPLGARGAQLAWAEFEVIDEKLAVRITRLS